MKHFSKYFSDGTFFDFNKFAVLKAIYKIIMILQAVDRAKLMPLGFEPENVDFSVEHLTHCTTTDTYMYV